MFDWSRRPDSNEVDSGSGVRDVVELRVHPDVGGKVPMLVPSLADEVPRSAADVLENDHRGLGPVHPVHHAFERLSGLASVVQTLLLVVEVGVVDAGGAGHEEVAVAGDLDEAAVGRRGLLVAELADVAEEDGRREVALDVGLLEGLDLAGEGVLDLQLAARLGNDSIENIYL